MQLRETWRDRLRQDARLLVLLDALLRQPILTVARAREELSTSEPTARRLLQRLVAEGLLERMPESRYGRLYVARPILAALGE